VAVGSNLLKLVLTIDFVVTHYMRSPLPKKDEPCITWESCTWSNTLKQKPGLDFKYQGSDPNPTFYLMDNFEQFNPSSSAFIYSSRLFLLIFLMACNCCKRTIHHYKFS